MSDWNQAAAAEREQYYAQKDRQEAERLAYIAGYLHGGSYPRIDSSPVGEYFREVAVAAYEDWVNERGFWQGDD